LNYKDHYIAIQQPLMLSKENLNSAIQQFYQYQQNTQSPIICTHWTQQRPQHMTLEMGRSYWKMYLLVFHFKKIWSSVFCAWIATTINIPLHIDWLVGKTQTCNFVISHFVKINNVTFIDKRRASVIAYAKKLNIDRQSYLGNIRGVKARHKFVLSLAYTNSGISWPTTGGD
jgi:hypothetical protein